MGQRILRFAVWDGASSEPARGQEECGEKEDESQQKEDCDSLPYPLGPFFIGHGPWQGLP